MFKLIKEHTSNFIPDIITTDFEVAIRYVFSNTQISS